MTKTDVQTDGNLPESGSRIRQSLEIRDSSESGSQTTSVTDRLPTASSRRPTTTIGLSLLYLLLLSAAASWGHADSIPLPIDVYLLLLGLAFVVYGCSVAMLMRRRLSRRVLQWLMIVALLGRAVTLCGPHRYNSDVWRYLWDGHVLASDLNPYAYPPDDERLDAVRDPALYSKLNPAYSHLHTVYGPVAVAAFALCGLGPSDPAWNVRALMTLGDISTVALLTLLLRRLRISESWALVYALNPLLIDSFAQRGQMEGLLLPLLVLAVLLLVRRRCLTSGVALALCVHVKIVAVVLAPLFLVGWLRVAQKRGLTRGWLGLLSCGFLGCIPLMMAGPKAAQGLMQYASGWRTNASVFAVIESTLGTSVAQATAVMGLSFVTMWLVVRAAKGSGTNCAKHPKGRSGNWFLTPLLRAAEKPFVSEMTATEAENVDQAELTSLIGGMGLVFASLLMFAPAVFPWYVTWTLPFTPLLLARPETKWFGAALLAWSGLVCLWYLRFLCYPPLDASAAQAIAVPLRRMCETLSEPWRVVEYAIVGLLATRALRHSFRNGVTHVRPVAIGRSTTHLSPINTTGSAAFSD